MKRLIYFFVLVMVVLAGCDSNEAAESDLTGNEVTYALYSASDYGITGAVTVQERKDGYADIRIKLEGSALDNSNREFPVHLHLGDVSVENADVAALLNPVVSSKKESETTLQQLSDESKITFAQLTQLDACIKVHLSASGPESDIVLAGGNIGSAQAKESTSSRKQTIATCGSVNCTTCN